MKIFITLFILLFGSSVSFAETYQIEGTFNGCEYGKYYPIMGGGVLECREYNYFYEYSPEVRSNGREVITIGDEEVDAYLHDGSVINTQVDGEFNGCDFDRRINFLNGLVFVCSEYSYSYSYMAEVRIIRVSGQSTHVYIDDEKYDGEIYR